MTIEFYMAYIPEKMRELGYPREGYYIREKHFLLKANEKRIIDAANQYYYLVSSDNEITVDSDLGSYNVNDDNITELQHEFQGKITLLNTSALKKQILFAQVIIKNVEPKTIPLDSETKK